MNVFETNPKTLKLLLTQIHNGELALPDFQRDFVWDAGAIEELIESIIRSYPAGSLLFLKHSGEGFQIREFEGAPELKAAMGTSYLVLDGQQRMTSLYQAFFGRGEHLFFLDLREYLESGEIEPSVWHESAKRSERYGYNKIEVQAEKLLCPLKVVMTGGFDAWMDEILDFRKEAGEELKLLKAQLRQVHRDLVQPILEYQFPVITLSAETPLDAVCKMFETLNRRGVKLTVFELLMARSFANKVSLRQLWDQALKEHEELEAFGIDPYYVLQIISLLSGGTIKRKEILEIEPSIVTEYWARAVSALSECIHFLQRNTGVLSPNLLPYNTMLVPMAAAWAQVSDVKGPKDASKRAMFKTWFWASVFGQAYEIGPSAQAVRDFKELQAWVRDSAKIPRSVQKLAFNVEAFFEITPKQRALYRGCLALVVTNGALDFHKAEKMTFDYMESFKVDDHHIFPQNFMKKKGDSSKVNCVLNRTLIDKKTNIRISDKAPSVYLREIEKEIGKEELDRILKSHGINLLDLQSDDFASFLKNRAETLLNLLRKEVGREIPSVQAPLDESDDYEEEDETSNPREKLDPSLVNAHPEAFLRDLPKSVEEKFVQFTSALQTALPGVWWKSNSRRVVFMSPEKTFMSIRLSKTGLHFNVFTDGKSLLGVEPILQKDQGGELWGRIKLRSDADHEKCIKTVIESYSRMKLAISEGRSTSWWATSRKDKQSA